MSLILAQDERWKYALHMRVCYYKKIISVRVRNTEVWLSRNWGATQMVQTVSGLTFGGSGCWCGSGTPSHRPLAVLKDGTATLELR